MFGLGTQELMIIVVIIISAAIWSTIRKQGKLNIAGPALVLRKFEINKTPASERDEIINITGRPGGILSWILTIIGLETEYFLKVTSREIRIKTSSLFGQFHHVVSLTSISDVHCGYLKPIGYLIFGTIVVLSGLYMWIFDYDGSFWHFLGGLIAGTIFFVLYWLLKKIQILVLTRAAFPLGLTFKRSVIENVPVDIERAKLVIEIINSLIVNSQKRELDFKEAVSESYESIKQKASLSMSKFCPHCSASLENGARFCTSCGRGTDLS